jgi:hypothetical protein
MTTFSIGFGHVAGTGPYVGSMLPSSVVHGVQDSIWREAVKIGGRHICTTDGFGTDELGQPEPCSVIVVEVPEAEADSFRDWLRILAEVAQQRCFAVMVGEAEFIGPVVPVEAIAG